MSDRGSLLAVALMALVGAMPAAAQHIRSNPPVKASDLDIVPIARWVSPTDKRWFADRKTFDRFSDYRERLGKDDFAYDDVFRDPREPDGPTVVDCARAKRIGVSLALTPKSVRRVRLSGSRILLDFVWTHSEIQLRGREAGRKVARADQLYSSGLSIVDDNRRSGLYTVTASYKGELVYSTAFDVRGCEP